MTKISMPARKPGRPASLKGGQRVNTTLDAETIAGAEKLGAGNISEGLRRAVEIALQAIK